MIPDGCYLNLPMPAYQADDALGGHDLLAILGNPTQFHAASRNAAWRALNPEPEEETAAKRFGSAFHSAILEPETFDDLYYVQPDAPDLPQTKDEINAALVDVGWRALPSGKKKDEFVAAARMAGVQLLSDWREAQAAIAGARVAIPDEWRRLFTMYRAIIDADPNLSRALTGGRAEVSVFWTDEYGVRLKCRYDYLRIRQVLDPKTYACRQGQEPIQTFCDAVESWGYDFLAAHYMDMRTVALPALVAAGKVYEGEPIPSDDRDGAQEGDCDVMSASPDDLAFFQKVAAAENPKWAWLACLTKGYPEVDLVEFPSDLMQFAVAAAQVQIAREKYREFRDKFGDTPDVAWHSGRGLVRLSDFNFGSYRAKGRGEVRWESGE